MTIPFARITSATLNLRRGDPAGPNADGYVAAGPWDEMLAEQLIPNHAGRPTVMDFTRAAIESGVIIAIHPLQVPDHPRTLSLGITERDGRLQAYPFDTVADGRLAFEFGIRRFDDPTVGRLLDAGVTVRLRCDVRGIE